MFIQWANENNIIHFRQLFVEGPIFTPYEISRQTHLMYTLNILATQLGGFYGRNELAIRYLEEYKESLDSKDALLNNFEVTSEYIINLNLDDNSYWYNKANMFSLFTYLSNNQDLVINDNIGKHRQYLEQFEAKIPEDYQLAAKEAVNGRQQRLLRNNHINAILNSA